MRQILLSLVFFVLAWASAPAQIATTGNRVDPASTFGACAAGNSIIIANLCAGATLGSKINAAFTVLGSNPGEVWVQGGGAFGDETSRITVTSNHVLRIFSGTYTSTGYSGVILLQNDSALQCEPGVIIEEPTHTTVAGQNMFVVVDAYNQSTTIPTTSRQPSRNIKVQNCGFKGARSNFHEGAATIQLMNCHNCEVSGNTFDGMHTIAVEYGAPFIKGEIDPLNLGNYAEGSSIHHNTFIHSCAVNIAMVNGQNISITDNIFLRPGITGCSFPVGIDIEPNGAKDRVLNIVIANNLMDWRDGEQVESGYGISVINPFGIPADYFGNILITGNTIIGALAHGKRSLSRGIGVGVNAYDVTVENNTIRFVPFSIFSNGTRGHFQGNSIFGGGAGAPAIWLYKDSTDNTVVGNRVSCNLALTETCYTGIQNDGAASNVVRGNFGPGKPTIVAGTGAGAGPTLTIADGSSDSSGWITLTTGKSPAASATVATVRFANPKGTAPLSSITLTPAGATAATLSGTANVYVNQASTSSLLFVLMAGSTPLAAATTYTWFYRVD